MKKFSGFLFAKLDRIGSKSEGPEYYLQQWNDDCSITWDNHIEKKADAWETDPKLHAYLAKKATLTGNLSETTIKYEKIKDYEHGHPQNETELELKLKIEGQAYDDSSDVLWINKMPFITPPLPKLRQLHITLVVKSLHTVFWQGFCPTTKLYDFILYDPDGTPIWQWSKCILFSEKNTYVRIAGGFAEIPVIWHYFTNSIEKMGLYTIQSDFIATNQQVRKSFEIKFAF